MKYLVCNDTVAVDEVSGHRTYSSQIFAFIKFG
jgi:hypothetical protein